MSRDIFPTLQIVQELNSPELAIAVLCETGRSLSDLVAAIPEAFHSAAVHATFPSISSQSSLDLDVGEHTTAAATVALEVFSATAEPHVLHLSNFLLNPTATLEDAFHVERLPQGSSFAAESSAVNQNSAISSSTACQAVAEQPVSSTSTADQHSSGARMCPRLQRFVEAFRRALGCSSLKELSLTNITFVGNEVAQYVLGAISQKPHLHILQFFSVSCIDASSMNTCIIPSSCSLSGCSLLQRLRIGWDGDGCPPPTTYDQMYSFPWHQFCNMPGSSPLSFRDQTLQQIQICLGQNTQLTELSLTNVPSGQPGGGSIVSFLSVLVNLQHLDVTIAPSDVDALGGDGEMCTALSCLTLLTRLRLIADERLLTAPTAQQIVSALRHVTILKKLDLSSWKMKEGAIRTLSFVLRVHIRCLESLAVAVSETDMATADMLDAVQSLSTCTELDLFTETMSASSETDAAFSHSLSRLHQLQRLTLTHCYLVEHPDVAVAEPELFQLGPGALSHTEPVLSSLSNLTSLDLSVSFDRDMESINVLPGLSSLSKLLALKICGTLLLDEGMKNLSDGMKTLSTLKSLSLQSLECSVSGAALFAECLSELVSLTYLALEGPFSYEHDIGLAVACTHLSRVSLLRHLVLDKNTLGPEVCQVLTNALPLLKDLESLSMYECGFVFDGLGVLVQGLARLTNLEYLCVTMRAGVLNDVLVIAPALAEMRGLRRLALGKCVLSDAGMAAIYALCRLPKLTDLIFWQLFIASGTSTFSDAGWGYVGELLNANTSIRRCNFFKAVSQDLVGAAAAQVFQGLSDDDPLRLSELAVEYRAARCRV